MNNPIEQLETTKQKDLITIKFDGEKSMSVDALCSALSEFKRLSDLASDNEYRVEYRIVANREGSFEIDLLSIVNIATLLLNDFSKSLTKEILTVMSEWFKVKIHLNKRPPKEVKKENQRVEIKNENGEVMYTDLAGAKILENAQINNSVIVLGDSLQKDNRSGIKATIENEELLNLKRNDLDKITSRESIKLEEKIRTSKVQTRLVICKLDLTGDSKWEFNYNKRIQAKIEDEQFKKKVSDHLISFSKGTQIDVDMRIETELDDENLPLMGSEKYFIEKVTNIIQPTLVDDNQIRFDNI